MASVFDAFFDDIQALLEVTYDCFKKDAEAHPDNELLENLTEDVECALNVFCRHRSSGWTRRTKDKVKFNMQDVEDVCDYLIGTIPLVPPQHSESLERLRVVMREAQRRFRNIDKTIRVRLVESTEGVRTEHAPTTYTINLDKTVQQAVHQTYPAFPGACRRVGLRGRALRLWDPTPHGSAFFSKDLYDTIQDGDEVDVEVEIEKPNGPAFVQTHLPEPSAADGGHSAHGPEIGPQARRVLELLQELKQSA
jgi:hypothetical protein